MKKNDKVRAPVDEKYLPGIVKDVEEAKGFRGYPYLRVYVEFLDETVREYRQWDLIEIHEEDKPKGKK